MSYTPTDEAAVRAIYEHAPICVVCGERIESPEAAERARRTFRLRHREPCTPAPRAA